MTTLSNETMHFHDATTSSLRTLSGWWISSERPRTHVECRQTSDPAQVLLLNSTEHTSFPLLASVKGRALFSYTNTNVPVETSCSDQCNREQSGFSLSNSVLFNVHFFIFNYQPTRCFSLNNVRFVHGGKFGSRIFSLTQNWCGFGTQWYNLLN